MIDPVWAGLIGALGGTALGSLVSLFAPLVAWRAERKRMELEQQQQAENERVAQQRALVREWREGLGESRREYLQAPMAWLSTLGSGLVGRPWFESLRPYLGSDAEELGRVEDLKDPNVEKLSKEIASIEQGWGLVPARGDQADGADR